MWLQTILIAAIPVHLVLVKEEAFNGVALLCTKGYKARHVNTVTRSHVTTVHTNTLCVCQHGQHSNTATPNVHNTHSTTPHHTTHTTHTTHTLIY